MIESHQQFFELIAKAKRVLIITPEVINADTAGAGTAMALFLQRQNKEVEILATHNYEVEFPFLPKVANLRTALNNTRSLVINVTTQAKGLEEISYQLEEGVAKIYLKSKGENFTPEDVTFESELAPYDLLITLGVEQLTDLGKNFQNYTDIFYNTPKINIDNQPGNKHFGAINIVNINSASLCEVVSDLIQGFETDLLNEEIATSLLTGIIARTHSFQNAHINPQSFKVASLLVEKGAHQQAIVKHLFKVRSLTQLKLLGVVLSRLQFINESALAVITAEEIPETAEFPEGVYLKVLKDLLENLSGKQMVGILAEDSAHKVQFYLAQKKHLPTANLIENFGEYQEHKLFTSGPYEIYEFVSLNQPLDSVKQKVLANLI
jgi:nanoRNase/pAp phosphatase (c-di-AMP/oligoRNAs hydrolase)